MNQEYKPIRANDIYVGTSSGKLRVTGETHLAKLKEVTKGWSLGAKITAINEELHNVTDTATKMEFLILKTKLLEIASLGKVNCPQCNFDDYFDY